MDRSSIVVFACVLALVSAAACAPAEGTDVPEDPSSAGAGGAALPAKVGSGPAAGAKPSPPSSKSTQPSSPATPPTAASKSCCKMHGDFRGKCVAKTAFPKDALTVLVNDDATTCQDGLEVCAPTELLDPKFKPTVCGAEGLLSGKYTGVCLSNCLDFGVGGLDFDQGNCSEVQTCVPCVSDGKPTGAPGCPTGK